MSVQGLGQMKSIFNNHFLLNYLDKLLLIFSEFRFVCFKEYKSKQNNFMENL